MINKVTKLNAHYHVAHKVDIIKSKRKQVYFLNLQSHTID